MATLEKQRVRAEIEFGNFSISTPNVVSFSVDKSRNQMSASFSASVKINTTDMYSGIDVLAKTIVIRAGLEGDLKTIFTGRIERCVANPVKSDASKFILNIAGRDVLSILEGQHISRRLKTYRDGDNPPERWGVITGIIKHNTPTIQKFKQKVYSHTAKAAHRKPEFPLYKTPDAFDRNGNTPTAVYGGIEVTAVSEE
jgi:hypothetical protein